MGSGVRGTGLKERERGQRGLPWQGGWPRGSMAWAEPKSDQSLVSGALASLTRRVCHVEEPSVFPKHFRGLEGL